MVIIISYTGFLFFSLILSYRGRVCPRPRILTLTLSHSHTSTCTSPTPPTNPSSAPPSPRQPHPRPIRTQQSPRHLGPPLVRIPALDPFKLLQNPDNHIPGLRERELLPKTDARPAVERHVRPSRSVGAVPFGPPLRSEDVGVAAPEVLAPVCRVDVPEHQGRGRDQDRRCSCGPAARGEDEVVGWGGEARVGGDGGVQA